MVANMFCTLVIDNLSNMFQGDENSEADQAGDVDEDDEVGDQQKNKDEELLIHVADRESDIEETPGETYSLNTRQIFLLGGSFREEQHAAWRR